MIRHIVLLRFLPATPADTRAALMTELAALKDRLPGIRRFETLRNVAVEPPVMHGFLDGFVIDLADAAARDAYLADPEHRAIGARLVAACGGPDGLVVFDHEL